IDSLKQPQDFTSPCLIVFPVVINVFPQKHLHSHVAFLSLLVPLLSKTLHPLNSCPTIFFTLPITITLSLFYFKSDSFTYIPFTLRPVLPLISWYAISIQSLTSTFCCIAKIVSTTYASPMESFITSLLLLFTPDANSPISSVSLDICALLSALCRFLSVAHTSIFLVSSVIFIYFSSNFS